LLVWTINDADVKEHLRHGLAESEAQSEWILETQLTDNALYAFMKIVVDIENSNATGVLSKYAKNKKLLDRFPQGFKVRMGFGLHHGWAIEGSRCFLKGCRSRCRHDDSVQVPSARSSRLTRRTYHPTSTSPPGLKPQPNSTV
jgi:hypothetical protein